jgi:hypothetical protein
MTHFSVIALAFIPLPVFILGACIFGSAAREIYRKDLRSSLFGLFMGFLSILFAGGGVIWLIMMVVIFMTGSGTY